MNCLIEQDEDGGWVRLQTDVEPLLVRGVYADTTDPVR